MFDWITVLTLIPTYYLDKFFLLGSNSRYLMHPQILGVVYDNIFTFVENVKQTHIKMQARDYVLKSLVGF